MKSVSWTNLSLMVLSTMSLSAYGAGLTGAVKIDGSSTVYSISEAVAEEYRNVEKDVKVTIGAAGTGAGYKKLSSTSRVGLARLSLMKSRNVSPAASTSSNFRLQWTG